MQLMSDDWQKRFIDQVVKGVDDAIDDLKEDFNELKTDFKAYNRATDRRLRNLENKPTKKLPPAWRDPKVIQIGLLVAGTLFMLAASATQFDVGRILQ